MNDAARLHVRFYSQFGLIEIFLTSIGALILQGSWLATIRIRGYRRRTDCQPELQPVECVYRQCVHLREVVKP